MPNQMTRKEVVEHARSWIGTPFKHQGRSARGVDCAGVLLSLSDKVGLTYTETYARRRYGRDPEGFSIEAELDELLTGKPNDKIRPGDIVLMRMRSLPQHVGVIGDYRYGKNKLSIIHSYESVGRVVEHRLADVWKALIVKSYRIPGVIG